MSKEQNNPKSDEAQLLARLKAGHEGAYRLLVQQYQRRLYSVAYGITLDPEESLDIVQDVFLKVHQNIAKFEGKSSLATWMHRITVNQSLNWQRRWRRRFRRFHQSLDADSGPPPKELRSQSELPDISYQDKELGQVLDQKLAELPEQARAVLVLKEVEGFSYEEIAKILKIKPGTVSSRLFYARKRLKESLGDYI